MIQLLKDKIAFLRGELSQEFRSNQKSNQSLIIKLIRKDAMSFSTINTTSLLVIKIVKTVACKLIHQILLLQNHQSHY